MERVTFKLPEKKGPNNKRADAIDQLAKLIGVPFSVILHKTFKMTELEIIEIFLKAGAWTVNPPALANKLLKEKNLEIKELLK